MQIHENNTEMYKFSNQKKKKKGKKKTGTGPRIWNVAK